MSDCCQTRTTAELAHDLNGRLLGAGDVAIRGVNAVDAADAGEITFIMDVTYARRWPTSRAAAAVVSEAVEHEVEHGAARPIIVVRDAELAVAQMLELFCPPPALPDEGISPHAWVHEAARVGAGVRIAAHVTVERGCDLGDDVVLHPGVRLYEGVTIGAGSVLHANVVVRERCRVGRRVIIHQNASIGADGFGYRPSRDGRGLVKMPHIGTVDIGDDVEIGAGTCVDRAKFGATRIGAGTKLDNLVQIAHNCSIGQSTVIAALTGIGGSVTIGNGVQMGGQSGIADHLEVGDGASIGARAGLLRNVPPGEVWTGYPAAPLTTALRQWAGIRKLPDLIRWMARSADAGGGPAPGEPERRSASDSTGPTDRNPP